MKLFSRTFLGFSNPMANADSPMLPIPPTTVTEKRSNRSAMMIVFLVVFIDLLGFGIVLPLLPRIAEKYVMRVIRTDGLATPAEPIKGTPELARANPLAGLIVGLLM